MDSTDGLPPGRRMWAIVTVALAVSMAVLDSSIANIGLPTIARDLAISPASSIWIINAYQLVIVSCLLPLASLGDIVGYRRVYQVGLVVFTLASLACAVSHSLPVLILARIVQGVGAAGIMSVNTALLRFIYPRARLGRGIAFNSMVVATSSAVGPSIASGILSVGPWPWLFAVNVPTGAVALAIAAWSLPYNESSGQRFDILSALLSAATFGLLIIGIDGLGHDPGVAGVGIPLLGAVVAGFVLVRRQLSRTAPLLPVDLLRNPVFGLAVATSVCSFVAQGLAYVSLPFFLENTLALSQVETGVLLTPWPAITALMAPVSGRLADRFPAGVLGGIGLGITALGLTALAVLPDHPAALDIVWRTGLCGFGFILFQAPNNRAMMLAAPKSRTGGASGMLGTARVLGQTVGAALVAVMFGLFGAHGAWVSLTAAAGVAATAACISFSRMANNTARK